MKKTFVIFSKVIIAVVTIYSFIGFFILPYFVQVYTSDILKKTLNTDSYIDSVHLNPYNFHIRLSNFMIIDEKKKNLLFFENFHFNIDPWKILNHKIVVKNIRLDNLKVDVDLDRDKRANFQYILDALSKNGSKEPVQEQAKGEGYELLINKFDLNRVVLVFTDYSKQTPFSVHTKPINMALKDIAVTKNHINRLNLKIDTNDTGSVELNSDIVIEPLSAKGDLKLSGINVNKIFNYIKTPEMNFDIDSKPLDLALSYNYGNRNGVQNIGLAKIDTTLSSIAYIMDKFSVTSKGFRTTIDDIKVTMDKDLKYEVKNIKSLSRDLVFFDKAKESSLVFTNLNTAIETVTSDKSAPISIEQSLNTPSKGELKARVEVVQEPLALDIRLDTKDIDITPYEVYVKDFANVDINSFSLSNNAHIKVSSKDDMMDVAAKTDIDIKELDISNSRQNQKLISVKDIRVKGLEYKTDDLYIKDIALDKPFISFYRNPDGSTNFSYIAKEKKGEEVSTKEQGEVSKFKYLIENVTLKDGDALFEDRTVEPNFKSVDTKAQVTVKNISSDKNTLTTITHKSIIDNYAALDMETTMMVSDPLEKIDASVAVQNLDLPSLSPYSGKYIGNKIANGKFGLNIDVKIDKGQLVNKNKIKIKDIDLGEKVESEDAINAPIGLAIALLEDSRGFIDLDVPIDGNLKDPKFHLGDVIGDVVTNMIVGIVSAPFKFLALIVGIEGDDLSNVEFAYGKYDIPVTQKEKLDAILKAFKERPNLSLVVKPSYIKEKDTAALADAKFKLLYPEAFDEKFSLEDRFTIAQNKYIEAFKEEEYKKLQEQFKDKKLEEFYAALLEKFKAGIKVSDEELNTLAIQRGNSIKEYLKQNKLEAERVIVKDEIKQMNYDSKIDNVIVEFEVDAK